MGLNKQKKTKEWCPGGPEPFQYNGYKWWPDWVPHWIKPKKQRCNVCGSRVKLRIYIHDNDYWYKMPPHKRTTPQ